MLFCLSDICMDNHPSASMWGWFQDPSNNKMCRCSSPLNKIAEYLHITYAHPLVYFKSSLDYLYLIQHKCYINSYKYNVNAM